MANILLAEDDENLGFMLEDSLKDLGHQVVWAHNGEEAYTFFEHKRVDLCIVDVMMPKMDGFELVKKIRAQDDLVPILFLTAKGMEEDRVKGFEIGGDDYITKPFLQEELLIRIQNLVQRNYTKAIEVEAVPPN